MNLDIPHKINVIADLDGTIALDHHRRKLIVDKNINAYFDACLDDKPNIPVIHYLQMLTYIGGYTIHIITGRSQRVRDKTKNWLSIHNVPYSTLQMRPQSTYDGEASSGKGFGADEEIKAKMLSNIEVTPENTLVVLDDRPDMVDWYRDLGYDVWAVRPLGKFY